MFRLLNVDGRAALEDEGRWFDLAGLSGDPTLSDPMVAVARTVELHALAERCAGAESGGVVEGARLGAPVPAPRQVFGIGLNYRDHAAESGMDAPPAPLTFRQWDGYDPKPTQPFPNQWHVEAGTRQRQPRLEMLTVLVPYRAGQRPRREGGGPTACPRYSPHEHHPCTQPLPRRARLRHRRVGLSRGGVRADVDHRGGEREPRDEQSDRSPLGDLTPAATGRGRPSAPTGALVVLSLSDGIAGDGGRGRLRLV